MLYNTDGCHGKFLKYQIQVKNEIVLIPPISGSLCLTTPHLLWCTLTTPITRGANGPRAKIRTNKIR